MPKPIDSENVIAWLNAQIEKVQGGWLHDYGFPTNVIAALTDVKCFVKNLPTIEPEVRHGRWLSYTGTHYTGKENEYGDPEYKEHIFFVCSNCRRKTVVREHFCPNCGAKMDGGDDNG